MCVCMYTPQSWPHAQDVLISTPLRPQLQDMAKQMQESSPSMYQQLRQEASRFQAQVNAQQQTQEKEEEKKEDKKEQEGSLG